MDKATVFGTVDVGSIPAEGTKLRRKEKIFLLHSSIFFILYMRAASSVVEHPALNRLVVGSNPSRRTSSNFGRLITIESDDDNGVVIGV